MDAFRLDREPSKVVVPPLTMLSLADRRSPSLDPWLDRLAAHRGSACLLLIVLTLSLALPGLGTLFPMDRDEPRFAQASKQMLETGEVVVIRFHDEARNKKPVGIYWLQAAAVAAGEALGVPSARQQIWLYRIPSLIGAVGAVLLTWWTALALTHRRAALLAGAMMASSVLLVVEAHLAKTDAVLLATVVAAMGVLARAFVARARRVPLPWSLAAVFWIAVAVGILIKGPIGPMVPLLAAAVLSARERSLRWLGALRPLPGAALCLVIALPWFVLITKASGGAFFAESIGHDMGAKVASAQESHGAPLGTYAAAFWVTAWPFAPFLIWAAPVLWRDRRSDQVAFLLAWIVPIWLLFETVPTKLPHYVLPAYPAVAILVAASLLKGSPRPAQGRARVIAFCVLLGLLPVLIPFAVALAPGWVATSVSPVTIAVAAGAITAALAGVALCVHHARRGAWGSAVLGSLLPAAAVYGFVFGWMLNEDHADLLALSPRLAAAGRAAAPPGCPDMSFATVGDREPSLVFETATSLLMTDAEGAARFLAAAPCRVALVEQQAEPGFVQAVSGDDRVRLASRVVGLNINGGHRLDIGIYARRDAPP